MKLSREKINRLSSLIAKSLENNENVQLLEDSNIIRLELMKLLMQLLEWDKNLDLKIKEKISQQKKVIHEGSPEWMILYKNYYQEELKNYGKYKK
ncbi:MAG: hypothetical protein A2Y62_13085 [Candidatus Fischerbacteria bacterium RBG_13_37_8]|uniref:DUF507 domain-containing protein n=1 Tax=Candidatus Fischerbacteria bacterium RBG_13_37_8 TaxID=1817863 RepID=A0A1F5V606_9BACT|nr:MAG: hypothetical protein A2Y62_13085 [Candidatus Fischerbacteria bacterium RBG_13_37_8]